MTLKDYTKKRDLKKSTEPAAKKKKASKADLIFCVQKHDATHLHYDFRLEMDGVLVSWAIPKGPTLDPDVKRLAIHVEDHPYDYKDFEGVIPSGYGAGTVMVWDQGTYELLDGSIEKGKISFVLHGEKLKGHFSLAKMKNSDKDNEWLFFKAKDAYAAGKDILKKNKSVLTDRTLDEIKADG